jgi:ribosomal protein L14E/L6E/L27E
MLLEVGRVCIKKYGRDAGKRAVVTKILDGGFVDIVTSARPRDRRCNPRHLEFLNEMVDVKDKALLNKALELEEKEPVERMKREAPKKAQK